MEKSKNFKKCMSLKVFHRMHGQFKKFYNDSAVDKKEKSRLKQNASAILRQELRTIVGTYGYFTALEP